METKIRGAPERMILEEKFQKEGHKRKVPERRNAKRMCPKGKVLKG